MKNTFIPSGILMEKNWYIVDANNQILGRLATKISKMLLGKEKPDYIPFLNMGVCIVIINAEKIRLSGKKKYNKRYKRHSGRPGTLKITKFLTLQQKNPEKIIEYAIKGMLPKGPLGRDLFRNVRVYKNETHPHTAQVPKLISLKTKNEYK